MTTTSKDPIAARLATLPLSAAARRDALAHIAAGESFAGLFVALAQWLEVSPALKPSYQD